jgi:hypothetical protein
VGGRAAVRPAPRQLNVHARDARRASVAQLTQGTIVANLGFTEVAFPHPLYHGDTMYSETLVTDKRLSASRPGQGIISLAHTAKNQDGVVVAHAGRSVLVWSKEAHEAPALLFCPADRPERYRKAAERADAVILDLEDAVSPAARVGARESLVAHQLDAARTIVRVNQAGTDDFALDLAALRQTA